MPAILKLEVLKLDFQHSFPTHLVKYFIFSKQHFISLIRAFYVYIIFITNLNHKTAYIYRIFEYMENLL